MVHKQLNSHTAQQFFVSHVFVSSDTGSLTIWCQHPGCLTWAVCLSIPQLTPLWVGGQRLTPAAATPPALSTSQRFPEGWEETCCEDRAVKCMSSGAGTLEQGTGQLLGFRSFMSRLTDEKNSKQKGEHSSLSLALTTIHDKYDNRCVLCFWFSN